MCPVTIIAGAALAGAAVSAVGSISAGNARAKAGRANASLLEDQAHFAQERAESEAAMIVRDNRRKMGAVVAAYGASGVQINQGTPLEVMSDVAAEGELSKRLRLYQGSIEALEARQGAGIARQEAGAAQQAGYFDAAGTLLTGGARFASSTYKPPKVA